MISVDISNIWGEVSLPDLLGLEAEVFAAHNALMDGTGEGKQLRGWLTLPGAEEVSHVLDAAKRIRETSDVLVVLGTDGSCLGARGAIELLQGSNRNLGKARGKGDPRIFFAGNSFSGRQWQELTHLLEGKDISLCVISKSGEDLEPAIGLRSLRWLLERRYGTEEAKKRICAVTDGQSGTLRQMAEESGWEIFAYSPEVSSEFSVLTPAGLLPMAVAGIDIEAMLLGAREAGETYDLRSYENPVWLYAAARELLRRKGKGIELLESCEPGFSAVGRWWQQLFASSGGRDGKGIFPAIGELPEDHYTLGRRIMQGERNLFATMLRFDAPEQRVLIGEDVLDPEGLNYLAGKDLGYVDEQVWTDTVEARADEGISMICAECGALNERTVGELFRFFELSCALCAYILGVNPYDRPEGERFQKALAHRLGKPGSGEE